MSVSGGGFGWTWVGSVTALVAIAGLVGTAACGSRTSMLDPDVYDANGPGGSSGLKPGGSAGNTGGGLLGMAGASVSPSTPSRGVDTSQAKTPCEQYCASYSNQCRQRLEGKDCLSSCQNELNGSGPLCQLLGIETLSCLTPFFGAKGEACGNAVGRALTQCEDVVSAFDECKSQFATGNKNPVSICQRMGDGGVSASCIDIFSCSAGPYVTFCSPTESPQFVECGCAPPSGEAKNVRIPLSKDPCFDATALCP